MRTILFTLLSLIFCVAHSQFIPQPMGYNPDSNFDGGIGSEDLMGMLSLFGSPFNSGDSLVVDYFEYSFIEHENGDLEADTLFVSEDVDIVYLTGETPLGFNGDLRIILPQGFGWKSVMVFCTSEFNTNSQILITGYGEWFGHTGRYVTVIRGHDGGWYGHAKE